MAAHEAAVGKKCHYEQRHSASLNPYPCTPDPYGCIPPSKRKKLAISIIIKEGVPTTVGHLILIPIVLVSSPIGSCHSLGGVPGRRKPTRFAYPAPAMFHWECVSSNPTPDRPSEQIKQLGLSAGPVALTQTVGSWVRMEAKDSPLGRTPGRPSFCLSLEPDGWKDPKALGMGASRRPAVPSVCARVLPFRSH